MSAAFFGPPDMLERKPPHGAACNSCGLCCVASLCPLAQHVFKRPALPGPCPALGYDAATKKSSCGLVNAAPSPEMRDAALLLIGSGYGCDARFNGEPTNEAFNAGLDALGRRPAYREARRQARALWGMD